MKIITFYSYKGGVGRSMCLANVAIMLAKWGHKVLIVDWDLEAPGLERYFTPSNFEQSNGNGGYGIELPVVKSIPGLIEVLSTRKPDGWKKSLIPIKTPEAPEPIHLISAGKRDENYFQRVRDFNVDEFYAAHDGGQFIENLRNEWSSAYDFVLIDSRTGITEINGICTIQMPDMVVLLFTATEQGFEGTLEVAQRAEKAQQKLPFDRLKLLFLPILTRVESSSEVELTNQWIERFSKKLNEIYQYWLPSRINAAQFLGSTSIPHVPFYTFGEKLPILKGKNDFTGMASAYENVASLIANKLQRVEEFFEKRELFLKQSGKNLEVPKVYISYNHADAEIATQVRDVLQQHKIDTIFDSDDMHPGQSIEDFIKWAHQTCDVYILIVSKNSLRSSWVINDLNEFLNNHSKLLIPLSMDFVAFDNNELFKLIGEIDSKANILYKEQEQLKKIGLSTAPVDTEITRLLNAKVNLPKIVERLRGMLILDLSGDRFDRSMDRVIETINKKAQKI